MLYCTKLPSTEGFAPRLPSAFGVGTVFATRPPAPTYDGKMLASLLIEIFYSLSKCLSPKFCFPPPQALLAGYEHGLKTVIYMIKYNFNKLS